VLTNAVYFKAGWGQAFNTVQTREGDFTLLDGQNVSIPMMSGIFELPYTQVGDLQAVELPYEGGAFSMLLLLPETGSFEDSIERLDSGLLNTIRMAMRPKAVQVALPKFQLDSAIQMRKPLIDLGMVDAFGEADFSGIDGSQELFIDQVYHQAFISVDEAGTEATGGSAVMMSRKGVPSAEMTFVANHPFIFLIRDVKSGAVLFLGHVINPDL
jgi:serpin B